MRRIVLLLSVVIFNVIHSYIFSSNLSGLCGKYLILNSTLNKAKYYVHREVNDVVVDTTTFSSEKTVFVGPFADYFVLQNLLDARGSSLGKILAELLASSVIEEKRQTLRPSSKMLRSRPLKLYKRDVPHARYRGTDFSRIFLPSLHPPSTPFISLLENFHDVPDKARAKSTMKSSSEKASRKLGKMCLPFRCAQRQ